MKHRASSAISSRRGLTLVEVIAATLLLGTLMVSTLLAYGQHAKQITKSERRLRVLQALDDQIENWYLTRRVVPVGESGVLLPGPVGVTRWSTRRLPLSESDRRLMSETVRIEAKAENGEVVAYLDVLQQARR